MKKIKITVIKMVSHDDLIEKYENKIDMPCMMHLNDEFISYDASIPEGFCESAWNNLYPFVLTLASGGTHIFGNWMKDEKSAMISCNDGFRPVSFLLEAID